MSRDRSGKRDVIGVTTVLLVLAIVLLVLAGIVVPKAVHFYAHECARHGWSCQP